jgi:hypothetical protein
MSPEGATPTSNGRRAAGDAVQNGHHQDSHGGGRGACAAPVASMAWWDVPSTAASVPVPLSGAATTAAVLPDIGSIDGLFDYCDDVEQDTSDSGKPCAAASAAATAMQWLASLASVPSSTAATAVTATVATPAVAAPTGTR